jgi:predicted permease
LIVRFARVALRWALPAWAREAARGDLDEEHARIVHQRGRAAAARWYAREALALCLRYGAERRHGAPGGPARRPWSRRAATGLGTWLAGAGRDLRFVARHIVARPAFWLAATLTLGVAIGLNAAIFSLVNAVLFKPLAHDDPDRVVRLYARPEKRASSPGFSYPDFRLLTRQAGSAAELSAVHLGTLLMADAGRSDQLLGEIASGSYFHVLGVPVIAGRTIGPRDDSRSSPPVALISEHYWRHRLGADPAVIGRQVTMNARPFTIVGIVSNRFGGSFVGAGVDAWIPLEAGLSFLGAGVATDGTQRPLQLLARLAGDVSPLQAAAVLSAAAPDLAIQRKEPGTLRLEVVPGTLLHGAPRRMATLFLSLLTVMVGLVLVIAASNVANLQLARTLARRREMAIRLSLGARRSRIVQSLVAESLVLAAMSLAIASPLAWGVSRALRSVELLPGLDLRLDLTPDARVFGATALVALAAGLIAALVPALTATRQDLVPLLREGGASFGGQRTSRLRAALVVAQVAVAVVVCVAAGLLTKSGRAAAAIELGFDRTGILATDIDLDTHGYTLPRADAFLRALLTRVSAIAGVEQAALASRAPLDTSTPVARLSRDNGPAPSPDMPAAIDATYYVVSPTYFATVGVPVIAGRGLNDADRAGAPQTAIANEFLVRAMWPGLPSPQAVGRRVRAASDGSSAARLGGEIEIVGIARNAKYRTVGEASQPHLYVPYAQHASASMALLVRTRSTQLPVREVQAAVAALDPSVQGFFTRTLDEHTRVALLPARLVSRVSTVVGAVSALLSAIGLHALISCVVAERRREFGLRMALGASAPRVSAGVVRQALLLSLAGSALGAVAAICGARLLSSLLYGVSPFDPVVYASVAAGSIAVAAASAWVPARRAGHVDPAIALRQSA